MSNQIEKYSQLKALSFLLLKFEENGKRINLYKNDWLTFTIIIVYIVEIFRNFYFFYQILSVETGLLYGNIIVSQFSDQRFFNLITFSAYSGSLVYFYFYIFKDQRINFYKLSKFLIILEPNDFSRQFNVEKKFTINYFKELRFLTRLNGIFVCTYSILTFSFYITGIIQLINLGTKLDQILIITLPNIIFGYLGFLFFYKITISAFTFSILYIKLLNAKISKLKSELDKLNYKSPYWHFRVTNHHFNLNNALKDYKISQNYFEKSLLLFVTPVLLCCCVFPTIIIVSKNYFTHRLIPLMILNVNNILIPVVKSNENFKKEFLSYLNSVHYFMAKSKNLQLKLKLIKIFDIYQKNNELKFSLFKIFYFDMIFVPKFLVESVTVTFLFFTFIYTQ